MFRKDRGVDRPSRPKPSQRGVETPRLEPGKAAAPGPSLTRTGPARRPLADSDQPNPALGRSAWPRPSAVPNRLTALLGEPVTRPVGPSTEPAAVPEPRRDTGKRMHIGQDISISGEITTCDVLVIDGHVDATVRDCGRLEIGPAGTLKGDVEVRNAEIGGRFDGELKVADRLTIRGTGRVSGVIRYGRLEVTVGGQLRGDVAPAEPAETAAVAAEGAATAAAGAADRADAGARPSAASILKPQEASADPAGEGTGDAGDLSRKAAE
jgi:cytoskeletal protein CcmA (bactofilin family)